MVAKKCRFLAVSLVTGKGLSEIVPTILHEIHSGTPGIELSEEWKAEERNEEGEEALVNKDEEQDKLKQTAMIIEKTGNLIEPLPKKKSPEEDETEEEALDVAPIA